LGGGCLVITLAQRTTTAGYVPIDGGVEGGLGFCEVSTFTTAFGIWRARGGHSGHYDKLPGGHPVEITTKQHNPKLGSPRDSPGIRGSSAGTEPAAAEWCTLPTVGAKPADLTPLGEQTMV
jgi:hypothetical protein